ncbi:hypothetical protein QP465_12110, partial [Staphylococcus capitis]
MAFSGNIDAYIGADTSAYESAMARVSSATNQAFQKAKQYANANSSQLAQIVANTIAKLESGSISKFKAIGQGVFDAVKIP